MKRAVAALVVAVTSPGVAATGEAEGGGPVPVEIVERDGRYVLLRGGEPYEIRGAGIDDGRVAPLAAHGGNSLRTWSTRSVAPNGRHILDEAAAHDVTVALCLDIGRERHGFDYDDRDAVVAQLEAMRAEVLKYKEHPALLAWIIGNEPNLHFTNPKVFDAIGEIAEMIHEVDGRHPATTALAGFDAELVRLVERRAPALDLLSVQLYADIVNLPRYLEESGFDGPLLVTEWGAIGHWEVPETAWGAPLEQTSSEKARSYERAYGNAIAALPGRIVGSYVFLWAQKQERTPTWFGMFLADGTETETIDVMHRIWTGEWPDNRAPRVTSLRLDGRRALDDVVVEPGSRYPARVTASDPDGDELRYRWEVMRESTTTKAGGDREYVPETLRGLVDGQDRADVVVEAPAEAGAYRLFVYVYDGRHNGGHANLPFLVR